MRIPQTLSGLLAAVCLCAMPGNARPTDHGVVTERISVAALSASTEQLLRPSEIRTRKLHLVRPDLLHYPLAYDVYC